MIRVVFFRQRIFVETCLRILIVNFLGVLGMLLVRCWPLVGAVERG